MGGEERMIPKGWKRHNDYCITRKGWYIAKNKVGEIYKYVLHDEAGTRYGNHESAEDAAAYADRLEFGMTA